MKGDNTSKNKPRQLTKGRPKSKKESPNIPQSELRNPKSGGVKSKFRIPKSEIHNLMALRKKAEKKLKEQTGKLHKLPAQDIEHLIHELGTHQIELEMQNEELRRAQEELEASRSRYSDLYDFAPLGYFTFNEKGLILEANLTAARELGVERGRIIKQPFRFFVITKDRNIFDDHLREVYKSNSRQICEVRLKRKSGIELHARLESILAQDLKGNNVCRTSLIDITENKKTETLLKEERDFISAVLSTEGALVVVLDLQGRIVSFNKTCELITGYSFDEVKGKPLWDFLLIPEEVKSVKSVFKELKSRQYPNNYENYWVTRDGRYRFISWSNTSLLDNNGNIKYVIGTGIDITERKRAEDETKRFASFPQLNPNPVLEVNSSGIIVFSNAAAVQTLRQLDIRDANVFLPDDITNILNALEQEKEEHFYREVKIKDRIFGEVLYLTPQFDCIRIYANDITERRTYQEALKNALHESRQHEETVRSERQRLVNILDSMQDGVYIVNQHNEIEYVNPLLEREYGPINGRKCHDYFEGRKKACTWCKNQEVFKGKTVRWEWYSEKTSKTYDLINTPLKNPDGSVSKLGIFRDITERKQSEEALRKSEGRYRSYVEVTSQFAWVTDAAGQVLEDIPALRAFPGQTYEQAKGAGWADALHPEDVQRTLDVWNRAVSTKTPYETEYRMRRHDGVYRLLLARGVPILNDQGNVVEWVGTCIDITETRHAEEALRDSRQDLDHAQEVGQIGSWRLDICRNVLTWSDENHRIFGLPKGTPMTYETFLSVVHPDDREYVDTKWKAGLTGEDYDIEHRIVVDGKVKWVREKAYLEFDKNNALLGGFGITQDITNRKQMEEELRKSRDELEIRVQERTAELRGSEERYRMLVETMNEGLGMDNKNGLLVYANDRLCEILGYSRNEIVGRPVLSFFDENNQNIIREQIRKRKSGENDPYRLEWIRKDGQKAITLVSPKGIFDSNGNYNGSFAVITDITERLRLESIAEAVNTMENIGFIFSGVRHEIGNPINSIKMALSVLKQNIDSYSTEKIKEYADRMLSEISRMEYLLKAMKSFNMYETVELMDTNMTDFMNKFLSLTKVDFEGKGIKVDATVAEPSWVYADPRALQQVLLNILTNASDALEGRENPRITIDVSKMANMVNIRIEDNGCGMTEQQQEDLFKPFYTTKSKGTGLGLVIAKKMMTKMKGFIELISEKDKGTIIDLFIPEGIGE